jgi:type IV pilus assembly protein PilA
LHPAKPPVTRGFSLVELMVVVMIVGVLAVLGTYGVRKYVASAKTAEARNSLGQISKGAITAFEREAMAKIVLTKGAASGVTRALCGSATQKVPQTIASVSGQKYQSNTAPTTDWTKDEATYAGFFCLKFSMTEPQYYMYNYSSDGNLTTPTQGTKFTATANGDLNGNGVESTFMVFGAVASNNLYVSPSISESSPEE